MKRLTIILALVALPLVAVAISDVAQAAPPASRQCKDGIDNDNDGLIDHPDDPGCRNRGDDDEVDNPTEEPTATPTPTLEPTPTPTDEPLGPFPTEEGPTGEAMPIPTEETVKPPSGPTVAISMVWLLTRGDWDCILVSETHPSVPLQRAKCFPRLDPNWTALNAPCAAPVMSDDTWECDKYTPWRRPLSELREVYQRHLENTGAD
jgi:hypothetical protein